jgi:hypothetical protein
LENKKIVFATALATTIVAVSLLVSAAIIPPIANAASPCILHPALCNTTRIPLIANAASPCILNPALCNNTGIPPIAVVGPDQNIGRTAKVPQPTFTLDGSRSYDPEGHSLTYKWTLIESVYTFGGTGIYRTVRAENPSLLTGADTATPSFVAGSPIGVFDDYTFSLTVNNGRFDSTNDARVTISLVSPIGQGNNPPPPPHCILTDSHQSVSIYQPVIGRGGGCGPGLLGG